MIKKFKDFYESSQSELSDEELEAQSAPSHVVTKNYTIPGAELEFRKYELLFVDRIGERLIVIDGANEGEIIDFDDEDWKDWESFILPLDSPKGKEFMHANRGTYAGKRYGI